MTYDPTLADRVRRVLATKPGISERAMFGGLAFMLEDKMCCGVIQQDLVVRLGPARYEEALWEPHVRPMDFTGKPLTGYVYVAPAGVETPEALEKWVAAGTDFVATLLATAGADAATRPRSAQKKSAAVEAPGKKPHAAKKLAAKKPAAKKPVAKKPVAKKPAARKPAAKRPVSKKATKKSKTTRSKRTR